MRAMLDGKIRKETTPRARIDQAVPYEEVHLDIYIYMDLQVGCEIARKGK